MMEIGLDLLQADSARRLEIPDEETSKTLEIRTPGTSSCVVRRPYVGEFGEQIAVGPYLVLRHLPICHDANERIEGIVGKCAAIMGK